MARKPNPGQDNGVWGEVLNQYLDVVHNTDGSLKDKSINLATLNATTPTYGQVLSTDGTTLTWTTSTGSGSVPDASTTTKGIVRLAGDLAGTAASPTVPRLATKANLASPTFTGTVTVPTPTNGTDAVTKTYVDTAASSKLSNITGLVTAGTNVTVTGSGTSGSPYQVSSTGSGSATDATTSTKGIVQLAGDLAGTAASPTVPGLVGKADASALTAHASNISNPHGVTKTQVGLGNVDNTSDVNKPVSTATTTSLNLKANLASPTFTGVVTVPTPTNGTDATTKTYVDTATSSKLSNITGLVTAGTNVTVSGSGTSGSPFQINSTGGGSVTDATTSAKGIVQLAGDLAGTAASPTVPGLAGKATDTAVVHNTGVETVAGVKTFSSSPVVPTPTTSTQAANKSYVDGAVSAASGGQTAVAKTANYTAVAGDFVIGNATTSGFTVTLPAPTNGARISVKKIDSSVNGILVIPPSGQIEGNASIVVNTQYQSQDFFSDDTNWYRV
jgi:hypothetical protein